MTAKESWKPVTIGGLTGILMGAGAMYAVQSVASSEDADVSVEPGIRMATVGDELSFRQAFEAARAEVGPGGAFRWHGHIYNTYTASEWKSLSHDEKRLFAEQLKPEVSAADIDEKQIAATTSEEVKVEEEPAAPVDDADVQVAQNVESTAPAEEPQVADDVQARPDVTSWNEIAQEENDVRVVGFKEVAVGGGRSINMQELDINGQRVAVIDVDKDGVPDLAMTDLNHNQQMDEGEVTDLHTGEAISFANDDAVQDMPDIDTFSA